MGKWMENNSSPPSLTYSHISFLPPPLGQSNPCRFTVSCIFPYLLFVIFLHACFFKLRSWTAVSEDTLHIVWDRTSIWPVDPQNTREVRMTLRVISSRSLKVSPWCFASSSISLLDHLTGLLAPSFHHRLTASADHLVSLLLNIRTMTPSVECVSQLWRPFLHHRATSNAQVSSSLPLPPSVWWSSSLPYNRTSYSGLESLTHNCFPNPESINMSCTAL